MGGSSRRHEFYHILMKVSRMILCCPSKDLHTSVENRGKLSQLRPHVREGARFHKEAWVTSGVLGASSPTL